MSNLFTFPGLCCEKWSVQLSFCDAQRQVHLKPVKHKKEEQRVTDVCMTSQAVDKPEVSSASRKEYPTDVT